MNIYVYCNEHLFDLIVLINACEICVSISIVQQEIALLEQVAVLSILLCANSFFRHD